MAKQTIIKSKKVLDQHHKPAVIGFIDAKGNTFSLIASHPFEVRENDSGSWIAYSPHFKTFGYSNKSEEEAIKDLRIAVTTFFDVHLKFGTLDKALSKFGFTKRRNVIEPPKLFNTPLRSNSERRTLNLQDENHRVVAYA